MESVSYTHLHLQIGRLAYSYAQRSCGNVISGYMGEKTRKEVSAVAWANVNDVHISRGIKNELDIHRALHNARTLNKS